MLTAKLFSQNNLLWSTIRNNDPSSQGGDNLLLQSYGKFHYIHHLQTRLRYLLVLKWNPFKRSVPNTYQVLRPWYGTSVQQKTSQYETLSSALLNMVITPLGLH